jgi:hypothetical protein
MNGHFIGRRKRADPCLAPTGSGVANGEAPLIGALRKICPRRSAIMFRANQNSPDSPAAGHRPSRLGNRCAGKTLPAWLRSRVRSRLAAPSAGIARAAGGRGCPGAAWGSQRRGPLGHVFMGRHATPDTARPECSDSRHDLRADVTSPQASAARRGIPFEPDRG